MPTPNTFLALGTFLGTVIGVGFFGLPLVASQVGFFPLLAGLLVMTPMLVIIHQRFSDVIAGTQERHRIPGYVGMYLGDRWKKISVVVSLFGYMGAMTAYLILGGSFVRLLLSPFLGLNLSVTIIIFFLVGVFAIIRGTKSVAWFDFFLKALFFVLVFLLVVVAAPHLETSFLTTTSWSQLPLAYGIIFFSLWGLSIVPEVVELSKKNRAISRGVIGIGLWIAVASYVLFTLSIIGVTGPETTPDAMSGFLAKVGFGFAVLLGVFGFTTTFTSYISLGLALGHTVRFDFPKARNSWFFLLMIPYLLVLFGVQNFIKTIGITGGILLGIEGLLVLSVSEAFLRRQQSGHRMHWSTMMLMMVLVIGILVEAVLAIR